MYYRITYDGIGIYEAFKQTMPIEEWKLAKRFKEFSWLPCPPIYNQNNLSYFTEVGFEKFVNLTLPIIYQYLDPILITYSKFDIIDEEIVYEDLYQIVTQLRN